MDPIRVGVIADQTGPLSVIGTAMARTPRWVTRKARESSAAKPPPRFDADAGQLSRRPTRRSRMSSHTGKTITAPRRK